MTSTSGRYANSLRQFIKFGLVGGSGVIVNLIAVAACKKIAWWWHGITEHDPFLNLLGSDYNIRWYHVFLTIAFLVANVWNFQLNRSWTFRSSTHLSWFREFVPFLLTGLAALVVSLVVVTALMNPESPFALPAHIFDDSSGIRTRFYWATLVSIMVAMPVNFVINKFWTFRSSRVVIARDPVVPEP